MKNFCFFLKLFKSNERQYSVLEHNLDQKNQKRSNAKFVFFQKTKSAEDG